MNKQPNFFIIGAPKCGTTSLVEYLNSNKSIYISEPKEPHYFATDFENYRVTKTEDQYKNIFKNVTIESAIGEASVFYLYSKEALKNIKEYNPDSKIIIMLRNPLEMLPSFHAQLIFSADENIENFSEAWKVSKERMNGKYISKTTREPKLLYYTEIAKYSEQIKNVKKYFPDNQIKIILFDDFKNNTKQVYIDTLDFLNIPQDGKSDFPRYNENRKLKSTFLNKTLKRPPRLIKEIYLKIKKLFNINNRLSLLNKLNDLNTIEQTRNTLEHNIQILIQNNYEKDILELSTIINKNLNHWLIEKEII